MSTHNSREEIKEIRKTIKDTFELMGQASGWVDLGIERICYLYDQELQKAREDERGRIEAIFKELVPPHAMDLEDSVWLKRLLNKAFNHDKNV